MMAMSSTYSSAVTAVSMIPKLARETPLARLIVPEAKLVPSIFPSMEVLDNVVQSSFSSILYHWLVFSTELSKPTWALSSAFHSSNVPSEFKSILALSPVPLNLMISVLTPGRVAILKYALI